MIGELSPGLILILGAVLVPFLPGRVRAVYMLALPVLAFAHVLTLQHGEFGQLRLLDLTLTTLRVDKLSLLFGYVFVLAILLGNIYAWHLDDTTSCLRTALAVAKNIGG